jgi:hypothetical protein
MPVSCHSALVGVHRGSPALVVGPNQHAFRRVVTFDTHAEKIVYEWLNRTGVRADEQRTGPRLQAQD